jgi:hypothetical protein
MENLVPTEVEAGHCLFCRLRAFFVSGEWFCNNQCKVAEVVKSDSSETN